MPSAATTLARAFHDDPLWSTLWPDGGRRLEQLRRMLAALVATTRAARAPARRLPDGTAVALWTQPGTHLRTQATVRSGFALPRAVARMSGGERRRLLATLAMFEQRRQALMTSPHWYLAAIGVDPSRHGRGYGTALVREGLARAQRDRTGVYLESETEANVSFYERLGFRVLEQRGIDALDGVPVWLMHADPAGSGA